MKALLAFHVIALGILSVHGESNIFWSNEFRGTSVDTNHWKFETGIGGPLLPGWENNEREYYTSKTIFTLEMTCKVKPERTVSACFHFQKYEH